MVGVGGRSKACENCRNRRVKCDLKPECSRCIKAHLKCGGPRGMVLISYNGYRSKPDLSPKDHDIPDGPVTELNQAVTRRSNLTVQTRLLPHQDELFKAFTRSNLIPFDEKHSAAPSTVALESFLALSTTYFGIKHQERAIVQYGLGRYGHALKNVQNALGRPHSLRSFDVLEAIMIMIVMELLISDREDGWVRHSRGLERLFGMREPESMTSLPCLLVIEKTRSSMIFAAVILREPTIFGRPEWKSIPWTLHPERIDSSKVIFDILADCPNLQVLRDHVNKNPNEASNAFDRQVLIMRSSQLLLDLERWKTEWASDASHTCTETISPPTTPRSTGAPMWSTVLQYTSLYHANVMTSYYGALIFTLQLLNEIEPDSSEYQARLESEHIAGLKICRSVDYHMDSRWGEQGYLCLLFPLRMAYDSVGITNPTIGTWIKDTVESIASGRQGLWKSAKTLLEMGG